MSEIETVVAGIRDMYDAFLAADRERFDSHLAADTTTWESHFPTMYTRQMLDEYRDRRTSAERPNLLELSVDVQRAEIWGDTALVAYLLTAVPHEGDVELSRVTEVMRRFDDGSWRIVHHHSELCASVTEEVAA